MPIINDPRIKREYILKSDRDRPQQEQTVFLLATLAVDKWKELASAYDRFSNSEVACDGPQMIDEAVNGVKLILTGWRNFVVDSKEITYQPEAIERYLAMTEIVELLTAGVAQQTLTIEDKKKLDSQSPSDSDKDVNAAPE
jgi:hypothetical protein